MSRSNTSRSRSGRENTYNVFRDFFLLHSAVAELEF
jgi:hypothetical protein